MLAAFAAGGLGLIVFTPLANVWFDGVSGLSPELMAFAVPPAQILAPLPAGSVWICFQRAPGYSHAPAICPPASRPAKPGRPTDSPASVTARLVPRGAGAAEWHEPEHRVAHLHLGQQLELARRQLRPRVSGHVACGTRPAPVPGSIGRGCRHWSGRPALVHGGTSAGLAVLPSAERPRAR